MKRSSHFELALLASLSASPAFAHVSFEVPTAASGTAYRAVLRVGHGCAGSPTTSMTVTIPAGFNAAQPLVKPGWTITTQVGKLAEPYEMHGTRYTEGVQEIRWTAKGAENALPDAFADEFVLRGITPKKPGTLWFKVVQGCEKGTVNWVEIPASGDDAHSLKSPAASLEVLDENPHAVHVH